MKKGFTGIKDLDLYILIELNDKDLLSACLSDKYVSNICKDDNFWRNRLIKRFGESYLEYKPYNLTWKQYYMQIIIDLEQIRQAMKKQIIADFTIGRIDEGLIPFIEEQIVDFLEDNSAYIENAVLEMYETYRDDNELEELRRAELDWYRDVLYEHVKTF